MQQLLSFGNNYRIKVALTLVRLLNQVEVYEYNEWESFLIRGGEGVLHKHVKYE